MTLSDALERLSVKIEKATDDYLATGDVDLGRFTRAERDILARRDLIGQIKESVRYRTLEAERRAEEPSDAPVPGPASTSSERRHGLLNFARGTACECEPCATVRMKHEESERLYEQRREEIDRNFHARLEKAITDYAVEMHMQWTTDLLSSPFALSDGTLITWGEATVEHHRERVEMFQRNAVANMEGAARHEAALRDLTSAGATTLNDLVAAGHQMSRAS